LKIKRKIIYNEYRLKKLKALDNPIRKLTILLNPQKRKEKYRQPITKTR